MSNRVLLHPADCHSMRKAVLNSMRVRLTDQIGVVGIQQCQAGQIVPRCGQRGRIVVVPDVPGCQAGK